MMVKLRSGRSKAHIAPVVECNCKLKCLISLLFCFPLFSLGYLQAARRRMGCRPRLGGGRWPETRSREKGKSSSEKYERVGEGSQGAASRVWDEERHLSGVRRCESRESRRAGTL